MTVGAAGVMLTLAMLGAALATVAVLLVTAVPVSVPSLGVAVQVTVSPLAQWLSSRVVPVAAAALPLTAQAMLWLTGSPSASVAAPGVQARVSPSVGAAGASTTAASTGALLATVTAVLRGVPVSVPSSGVTVQATVSPRAKRPERVGVEPTATPPTVQATVDWSASPSASEKPDQLQLRVSEATGLAGEMATLAMDGAVLSTVTLSETGLPVSVPSSGVTVQVTVSPLEKAPESVVAVPAAVPLTVQATVDWSVSPSASEKPDQLQVRVSEAVGETGRMLAAVSAGALFWMVTAAAATGAPASVPSVGVRVQATSWPRVNQALSRVAVVAATVTPSTVQDVVVVRGASPSASVVAPGVHWRVSSTVGALGLRVALARTGGVFWMVSWAVAGGPSPVPSVGVTVTVHCSPLAVAAAGRVAAVLAVETTPPTSHW